MTLLGFSIPSSSYSKDQSSFRNNTNIACMSARVSRSDQKARMVLRCTNFYMSPPWVGLFSKTRVMTAIRPWTCLAGYISWLSYSIFFQLQNKVLPEMYLRERYVCLFARFKSAPYNHMVVWFVPTRRRTTQCCVVSKIVYLLRMGFKTQDLMHHVFALRSDLPKKGIQAL
jgi:hypothetical protein